MGISLSRTLTAKRHPDGPGGVPRHSIDGTPADAVKYGLQHILRHNPPRLVASGINLGPNLGLNIRCSGTVGAAFEAVCAGIMALAVSVDYVIPPDWDGAKHYARLMAEKLLAASGGGRHSEEPYVVNLNVPSKPPEEIPGLVVARQGVGGIRDLLSARPEENGTYKLTGEWIDVPQDSDCDFAAFRAGNAVVTPLRFEMTHPRFLDHLREHWQTETLSKTE